MRLLVTLLSLTVTATALVALNGAMMGGVAEESSGGSNGRACSSPTPC